ncbi:MAG TPA: Holliday junction resolvase RuvX [Anaerolineales bacterium]
MRVLGVDHGEKRIGLAISDATGMIARPLSVIEHISRAVDAAQVAAAAADHEAELIVIGQSFDEEGRANLAGRRAGRFAEALKTQTALRIVLWDESMSTADAREFRREAGTSRKKRRGHLDEAAAAVLLQSYLDAQRPG